MEILEGKIILMVRDELACELPIIERAHGSRLKCQNNLIIIPPCSTDYTARFLNILLEKLAF